MHRGMQDRCSYNVHSCVARVEESVTRMSHVTIETSDYLLVTGQSVSGSHVGSCKSAIIACSSLLALALRIASTSRPSWGCLRPTGRQTTIGKLLLVRWFQYLHCTYAQPLSTHVLRQQTCINNVCSTPNFIN